MIVKVSQRAFELPIFALSKVDGENKQYIEMLL